jgi:uncharacterized protein YxeA
MKIIIIFLAILLLLVVGGFIWFYKFLEELDANMISSHTNED